MSIKLDDDFRLEPDQASWNLVYERFGEINPATGKRTVSRNQTYHANLKQALKQYVNDSVKSCESVEEVLAKLDELHDLIDNKDFGNLPVSGVNLKDYSVSN